MAVVTDTDTDPFSVNLVRFGLGGSIRITTPSLLSRPAKRAVRIHGRAAIAFFAACAAAWVATWDVDDLLLQGVVTIGGVFLAVGLSAFALREENLL